MTVNVETKFLVLKLVLSRLKTIMKNHIYLLWTKDETVQSERR
jgi:hypothetical protein